MEKSQTSTLNTTAKETRPTATFIACQKAHKPDGFVQKNARLK